MQCFSQYSDRELIPLSLIQACSHCKLDRKNCIILITSHSQMLISYTGLGKYPQRSAFLFPLWTIKLFLLGYCYIYFGINACYEYQETQNTQRAWNDVDSEVHAMLKLIKVDKCSMYDIMTCFITIKLPSKWKIKISQSFCWSALTVCGRNPTIINFMKFPCCQYIYELWWWSVQ